MATFSLTDLRDSVSKKYASTIVENGDDSFVLQNMLQLPEKKRDKVLDLVDNLTNSEAGGLAEDVKTFKKIIEVIVEQDRGAELLELIGDNAAMLMELGAAWMEGTELGEAERS